MRRDDFVYLRHIHDAVCRIEQYTKGMNIDSFIDNSLVQAGVIRELEIIGEAAKRISTDTKNKCHEIPWRKMAGARDKLIHQYFGVDIHVVWDTVDKEMPGLKANIEAVLKREGLA